MIHLSCGDYHDSTDSDDYCNLEFFLSGLVPLDLFFFLKPILKTYTFLKTTVLTIEWLKHTNRKLLHYLTQQTAIIIATTTVIIMIIIRVGEVWWGFMPRGRYGRIKAKPLEPLATGAANLASRQWICSRYKFMNGDKMNWHKRKTDGQPQNKLE